MSEEMFGPYRLEALIGRGGMGEVHRAYDTVHKRMVAIKRLPARLAADGEFEARFRTEAELVARLREPHIIPIHDYGEIDGRLFLDMRLVEGRDLAALLTEHGPLPPDRAVAIVTQVAAALDAAHDAGLVHRDVKPANVLVVPDASGTADFAYVADFGIARAVSSTSTSLTATGATVGSLDYMAPERFTDGHGDLRVDVYSLGCLLFEALTARRPFPGEGLPAMIHAHLHAPPPRPSDLVAGLPAGLDAVVARAMAKNPDDRYARAGDLAAAARAAATGALPDPAETAARPLSAAAETVTASTAEAGTATPARRAPRRVRGLLVGALTVAVSLALVGAALVWRTGGGGEESQAHAAVVDAADSRRVGPTAVPTTLPAIPPTTPSVTLPPVASVTALVQPDRPTAEVAVGPPQRVRTSTASRPSRAAPRPATSARAPDPGPAAPAPEPAAAPRAPRILGTSTYREGVLVYARIRFEDADGDAETFGFRGVNGSGWGAETHPLSSPSYGRVSGGRVDYPFNQACGQPNEYESDVQFWITDGDGRRSAPVVVHVSCS